MSPLVDVAVIRTTFTRVRTMSPATESAFIASSRLESVTRIDPASVCTSDTRRTPVRVMSPLAVSASTAPCTPVTLMSPAIACALVRTPAGT